MQAEKICNHITEWLVSYARQARMTGFVVGVSGGIDSAVTSALCGRTGLDTLCLDLPIHQAKDQQSRALKHINALREIHGNVRGMSIDLSKPFDTWVEALPDSKHDTRQIALVNSRARFRMTTLYYFAALERKLVAGTGNKVEDFGIGFFTKYGDGGVDISPIADLNKSEVYELGRYLHIIDEIMSAPPTDGLWADNRTDEAQIGATYRELEWAMDFVERGGDESNLTTRQRQVLQIYRTLHKANLHKIKPIPVCKIPEEWKGSGTGGK
ncbi:MAG: NAD(+) synthase [Salibacteraceae bacterium]